MSQISVEVTTRKTMRIIEPSMVLRHSSTARLPGSVGSDRLASTHGSSTSSKKYPGSRATSGCRARNSARPGYGAR